MTDQQTSHSTVITLVLPPDHSDDPATVTIQHADIDHTGTFECTNFADICRALNNSLKAVSQVQPREEPAPDESESSETAPVNTPEPEGRPPYRLQTTDGKPRTLTMLDPFELQERYHKTNRSYRFDELDEALSVAEALVAAGEDDVLHLVDANGDIVQDVSAADMTGSDASASAD
jgi:hypothetical protein